MIAPFFDPALRAALALRRRTGEPRGVLLVRSGGLGDTVLFAHLMPRFRALARTGEPIALLTPAASAKTAFLLGPDVEVIAVDYRRVLRDLRYRARTFAALHARNFRLVVSTDERRHPLADEAMIAAALAPEALAMAPKAWPKHDARLARNRRLYTRVFEGARGPMHVMERWARYADWLTGTPAPAPVARLADDGLAAPVSLERPTVAIQPFSAVALKQPAPDLWRAVLAEVPPDHDVLLLGAPADLARSPAHADLLKRPRVRFEPAPFAQLVPILRGCRLVVSADTATAHLAIAVGAPTVVLASAAWTGELVPYPPALIPPGAEFVYVAMPCAGCFANCVLPAEDGMYPCVARLDPRRIAARVGERLTGGSSNEGAGR